MNCFSNEHTIEDCPKDGASDWKAALLSIQTGFASRQAGIDVEVIPDDDETPDDGQDAKQDTTMEDIQDDDPAPKEESIASKTQTVISYGKPSDLTKSA